VYSDLKAYQDSKLAQVLHTKYLDTVLQKKDANIRVYALHPGIIQSGLWIYLGNFINNIGSEVSKSGLLRVIRSALKIQFIAI
jgi:NAD(P)-dependent dehydrogenase (short-subunit alcohol dehydrogenase family)